MIDHARAADVLRRFAGTLVDEYNLAEVLESLGEDVATILGCAGAGAMLGDREGNLRFVSTSDEVLTKLEQLQLELDEGPCLQAYRTEQAVVAADLTTDTRFPAFAPRALEAGMQAVYSFPMQLGTVTIGALNLYSLDPGELDDESLAVGQTFADVATIYVVHARDLEDHQELTAGLQKALDSRIVIEQAKGFLAATWRIEPQEAFEALRRYARSHNTKVHGIATDIVSGQLDPDELRTRAS